MARGVAVGVGVAVGGAVVTPAKEFAPVVGTLLALVCDEQAVRSKESMTAIPPMTRDRSFIDSSAGLRPVL